MSHWTVRDITGQVLDLVLAAHPGYAATHLQAAGPEDVAQAA